jgi:tetratricopeptide (TPR) repeat protein
MRRLSVRRALLCCGALLLCAARGLAQPRAASSEEALHALGGLLERGDYAAAEAGLRARVASEPGARLVLGRVLLETGRYAEAAVEAELAASAPELLTEARTLLGEALTAQGQQDAAERAFRSVLEAGDGSRARVLLGRLLLERGRRADAAALLEPLASRDHAALGPDRAAELTYVAIAARALGRLHLANDTFRAAAEADPTRVETQLEWAQLFLEKYDPKHAAESVLAALARNKHNALAHVLMARLALLQALDFEQAEAALAHARAENPQLVAAFVTRAGMALRNMDIAGADRELDQALAIDPVDLEALSVRAAVRFLDDDVPGFAAQEHQVLALNPHFSRFYSIVGEYAEWEHRYPEIVSMAKRALAIDPEDALARATLGLNLLRMGDETAGLAELHKAWERDRFNVQVYNTLNLYDEAIKPDYQDFSAKPFRIRLHKTERAILEPYLVPMLQRAYAQMRERYAFTPEGPLRVELYADRAQFSVRTTGLPNAGVQGVCFGKVVTGLSPRGGPFNWGQIVWHELSHVFHLQLSKNHVPRWFTEGLAEYETVIARPEWKREDDFALWKAMRAQRLPPLAAMNVAFTHARTPDDLMTAYYLAYRAVDFIIERYGWDKVRPILVAFGAGKKTAEVVQSVLGVSLDELDAEFRARLSERLAHFDREFSVDFAAYADLAAVRAHAAAAPSDPEALAGLAMAEVLADHIVEASRAGKAALKLAPTQRIAHFALARVALSKRDAQRAERCLQGIVRSGADGYLLRMLLARGALARHAPADAVQQATIATQLDPDRLEAWRLLLELAPQTGDEALGLRAVRAIALLDQHDASVHAAYLAMLVKSANWSDVVAEGETALYIDPENPAIHLHLGEAYVHTGDAQRGLIELNRALALGYAKPGVVHLARARAFLALRDEVDAKREIESALAQDPALLPKAEALLPQ